MNHRPHYPPPESQQQNNDPLGQDLHAGSEIVMIFVAIFGLWKYIVAHSWRASSSLPVDLVAHRSFNTKQKLILLVLLACPSWLFVLASSAGIDPAFHVLLAHQMRP